MKTFEGFINKSKYTRFKVGDIVKIKPKDKISDKEYNYYDRNKFYGDELLEVVGIYWDTNKHNNANVMYTVKFKDSDKLIPTGKDFDKEKHAIPGILLELVNN